MAATITVNSTDDSNIRDAVLTLREAILIANGTLNVPALTVAEQAQINNTVGTAADRDTIAFNIGAIGSQQLIQPFSALPPISDPAIVDRLQTNGDEAIVSNHIGTDPTGMVDRGNLRGIWIDGVPDNRIENNLISGRDYVGSGLGIEISGIAARNNQVIRNRIGTDVTGNVAIGNNYGILISNAPRTAS